MPCEEHLAAQAHIEQYIWQTRYLLLRARRGGGAADLVWIDGREADEGLHKHRAVVGRGRGRLRERTLHLPRRQQGPAVAEDMVVDAAEALLPRRGRRRCRRCRSGGQQECGERLLLRAAPCHGVIALQRCGDLTARAQLPAECHCAVHAAPRTCQQRDTAPPPQKEHHQPNERLRIRRRARVPARAPTNGIYEFCTANQFCHPTHPCIVCAYSVRMAELHLAELRMAEKEGHQGTHRMDGRVAVRGTPAMTLVPLLLSLVLLALLGNPLSGVAIATTSGPLLPCGTSADLFETQQQVANAFRFVKGVCKQRGESCPSNQPLPTSCSSAECQRAVKLVADSCSAAISKDGFLKSAFGPFLNGAVAMCAAAPGAAQAAKEQVCQHPHAATHVDCRRNTRASP